MTPPPDSSPLYHYTSAAGLLGIVRSAVIWASNATFLNDAQELASGSRLFRKMITTRAFNMSPDAKRGAAAEPLAHALLESVQRLQDPFSDVLLEKYSPYITCFCESGDLLSQWRGYAGASGYAIMFNRAKLDSMRHVPSRPNSSGTLISTAILRQVLYDGVDDPRTKSVIDDAINLLLSKYKPSGASPNLRMESLMHVAECILPALPMFKDKSFSEEREWRLLANDKGCSVLHRSGPNGIVPYIEIPLPRDSITGVRVSPGPNEKLRIDGVKHLLDANGYGSSVIDRVVGSAIPFRG